MSLCLFYASCKVYVSNSCEVVNNPSALLVVEKYDCWWLHSFSVVLNFITLVGWTTNDHVYVAKVVALLRLYHA